MTAKEPTMLNIGKEKNQIEKILNMAKGFSLFKDQNKDAYVFLNNEAIPLRSKQIKKLLAFSGTSAQYGNHRSECGLCLRGDVRNRGARYLADDSSGMMLVVGQLGCWAPG